MRTTLTLDPDTEALLKRLMSERGISLKEAVNTALRAGLTPPRPGPALETHSLGVPRVPLNKAFQLAAEMEDEELVRKLSQGK